MEDENITICSCRVSPLVWSCAKPGKDSKVSSAIKGRRQELNIGGNSGSDMTGCSPSSPDRILWALIEHGGLMTKGELAGGCI